MTQKKRGQKKGNSILEERRQKALLVDQNLSELWPDLCCTLEVETPWQLLFSAILAAQCTDKRVNQVTSQLYQDKPRLEDYAQMTVEELEPLIRSCGLYHHKAQAIQATATVLIQQYGGQVPQTMEELLSLPGVGRKIANLVLGDAFGIPGIVVDTHCQRVSTRLGLTQSSTPAGVERDLRDILPETLWTRWGHAMVQLGREYCQARSPHCQQCPVLQLCPTGQRSEKNEKERTARG